MASDVQAELETEKSIALKHQRTVEQLKRERDLANTEAQNKREEVSRCSSCMPAC